MEMYGKIRCVTYPELVTQGNLLSVPSYKKKVRAGILRVVRPGKGQGSCALIDYNSLPDALREAYDRLYPDAQKDMQQQFISQSLRPDQEAVDYYRGYRPKLSLDRQAEYVLNAQVLAEMVRVEKETEAMQKKCGFLRKGAVWDAVLGTCEKLRSLYGHTLPVNAARLRQKFNAYKQEGYSVLVNKNAGNQTARKIGPREGRLLLKLKRSKFPAYTDMQLFEEYNRQAPLRGLRPVTSPQTVVNFLYRPDIQPWWYAAVYGEVAFKNKYQPQFDTRLPEMPNTLWYGDGTKINLYYKEYDARQRRMVARTTDVYEVMDACTEMFLGCSFGPENFRSQYEAYRMAVETWHVKPYEIVTDNQGGHKKEEARAFFRKICRLHKTTMPHNGQSKSIESAFGRFQQQVLHRLYNYSGQNVTAVKESSRANVDQIMANIDRLPTLDELKAQYLRCREEWADMPHPGSDTGLTRREMYTTLSSPHAEALSDADTGELFKLVSPGSVRYGREGFVFELNRQEYRYMVYGPDGLVDMDFHLSHIGTAFHYRYDPHDMGAVELWKEDASGRLKYAATATTKKRIHRATAERTPQENEHLSAQLRANRRALAGHYIASEELLLEECMGEAYTRLTVPRPPGISQKEMDALRREYEEGRLTAPASYPEGTGPGTWEPDEAASAEGLASVGQYTKETSSLTDIDLYEGFFN